MVKRWEHGNIAIVNHSDNIKKSLLIQQKNYPTRVQISHQLPLKLLGGNIVP
jgi:hypothetical protein